MTFMMSGTDPVSEYAFDRELKYKLIGETPIGPLRLRIHQISPVRAESNRMFDDLYSRENTTCV